jgi:signal transduction histidine kinase
MGKDLDKALTHTEQAELLIDNLREELTGLIKELLPPVLEDKGLVAALRQFTDDWLQQNEIELDLQIQNERPLPVDIEQAILIIVRETLSNVARQATHVLVRLVFSGQDLMCTIKDDGIGFNLHEKHSGFGLRSLQERASGLGSELNIKSALGEGTEVSFTVLSARSNQIKEEQ